MKLSLADWNKRVASQKALDTFLNTTAGRQFVEVLEGLSPRMTRGEPMDAVTANIELGWTNGYQNCLNLIQILRKELPVAEAPIEATYGVKDEDLPKEE